RHTRWPRDWSSDVCSSDLAIPIQIDYRTALWIGIAQVCSLIPGVSRSGATIMGALLAGVARPAAAEFSFLLAIPVMFAATGLDRSEERRVGKECRAGGWGG